MHENLIKKILLWTVFGLLINFFPQASFAADQSCECKATVVGKGCTLSITKNLAYGASISVSDIYDGVDIAKCKKKDKNFVLSGQVTSQDITFDQSSCKSTNLNTTVKEYTYNISCKDSEKKPGLGLSPADGGGSSGGSGGSSGGTSGGGNKYDKDIIHLQNPIGSAEIPVIVGRAIFAVMGIMGSLALVVFVYGGFKWLTAAGNSESVQEGTQAMTWAAIGIFIIFASYAILQLVFKGIGAIAE